MISKSWSMEDPAGDPKEVMCMLNPKLGVAIARRGVVEGRIPYGSTKRKLFLEAVFLTRMLLAFSTRQFFAGLDHFTHYKTFSISGHRPLNGSSTQSLWLPKISLRISKLFQGGRYISQYWFQLITNAVRKSEVVMADDFKMIARIYPLLTLRK